MAKGQAGMDNMGGVLFYDREEKKKRRAKLSRAANLIWTVWRVDPPESRYLDVPEPSRIRLDPVADCAKLDLD